VDLVAVVPHGGVDQVSVGEVGCLPGAVPQVDRSDARMHGPQNVHQATSKRKSPRTEHFQEKTAVTAERSSAINTF